MYRLATKVPKNNEPPPKSLHSVERASRKRQRDIASPVAQCAKGKYFRCMQTMETNTK